MKEYPSDTILVELQFNKDKIRQLEFDLQDADILSQPSTEIEVELGYMVGEQIEACQKYLTKRMIEIHVHKLPIAEEFAKVIEILQRYGYPFPVASPNSVGHDDELPF